MGEGFLQIDPQNVVAQDALMRGMMIFGDLLGMESPRKAAIIERLSALVAWQAQANGKQPTAIKEFKPHGQPREVQGVNWGSEIHSTQYRPTPRDEYQSIADWLGVGKDGLPEDVPFL